MPFLEQRRAARMACALPARLYGRGSDLDGTVEDVSRIGIRLSLPLASLCEGPGVDMLHLARAVEAYLGPRFNLDLNPEMLGPLVRKRLRIVRIGQDRDKPDALELGGEFGVPLSEDESRMLELNLPPLGHVPPLPVRTGRRSQRYEAYLHPSAGHRSAPLAGTSSAPEAGRALFHASRATGLDVRAPDVTTLALALAGAFGPEPVLELRRGTVQIWSGRTRIQHIETAAPASSEVRVHVRACDVPGFGARRGAGTA